MTQSIATHRNSVEHELRKALSSFRELHDQGKLKLQYPNKEIAFTKDLKNHSVLSVSHGGYQPISDNGLLTIIVYVTSSVLGCAMYDEDYEVCLQIDTHEVVNTWADEPPHFQREMLSDLLEMMHDVIERSV